MKRLEKQILALFCNVVALKLCQWPYIYKNCQKNEVWRGLGRVRSKVLFLEIITHKITEAFFDSIDKICIFEEDWALDYYSMKF